MEITDELVVVAVAFFLRRRIRVDVPRKSNQ